MATKQTIGHVTLIWRGPELKKTVRKAMTVRVRKSGLLLQREVQNTISSPARGTTTSAGVPPRRDLGNLIRSIQMRMDDDLTSIVFTNARQARLLEFGGEIRPRNKRALAIPLSPKAKRFRGPAREFRPNGRDLEPIIRPGKPTLLVEKRGKKGGLKQQKHWIIHYVLSDRARIPRHPFMRITLNRVSPKIVAILREPLKGDTEIRNEGGILFL